MSAVSKSDTLKCRRELYGKAPRSTSDFPTMLRPCKCASTADSLDLYSQLLRPLRLVSVTTLLENSRYALTHQPLLISDLITKSKMIFFTCEATAVFLLLLPGPRRLRSISTIVPSDLVISIDPLEQPMPNSASTYQYRVDVTCLHQSDRSLHENRFVASSARQNLCKCRQSRTLCVCRRIALVGRNLSKQVEC